MHSEAVASRSAEQRESRDPKDSRESRRDSKEPRNGTPQLDAVSLAIVEQLQEDGRRPYAAIGKAVGLSEAAVRQRVQKLLDQGVMQIVAVTDPLTVGFRRQAMLGINVDGDLDPVADALTAMSEVEYIVITAGFLRPDGGDRLRGRRPPPGGHQQAHPDPARRAVDGEFRLPQAQEADLYVGNPITVRTDKP